MNTLYLNNKKKVDGNNDKHTKKGVVFIPDISGFTSLVHSTDMVTGKIITYELLSTIIKHNGLNMKVAEIEGDAVFFYTFKSTPSVDELYAQFERLRNAFDAKVIALQNKYGLKLKLHLKAIAHYGEMAEFRIGGFRKLYGEVVVEAHRLLKNTVPGKSYLLITDDLMAAADKKLINRNFHKLHSSKLCELYGGLRNLCFTYILFETLQLTA